jgi:hypothetical protein
MPKRKTSAAQGNKEYECDCQVKCHGGKAVSRRTFDRHSKYRIQSALLPDALHDSSEEESDSENTDGSDSDNESNESLDGSPAKKTKVEHEYYWNDDIFRQSESQNDAVRYLFLKISVFSDFWFPPSNGQMITIIAVGDLRPSTQIQNPR